MPLLTKSRWPFRYYLFLEGAKRIPVPLSQKRDPPGSALLAYQADPIRESLKLLGRKWTLLIIRDIAFLKFQRFGQILKNNPGLTPRILSRRLQQMRDEGLVSKTESSTGFSVYALTPKGEDAVYILLAMLRFGIRHYVGTKKGRKQDEESVIKDLQYEIPENVKWSY